jgi:hypothetical protein
MRDCGVGGQSSGAVNGDAKAPKFKVRSEDDDWQTHLYNQERMINQQDELLGVQKRLVEAMEKVASPERVRGVEQGQEEMVTAVKDLTAKMSTANEQLGLAVYKLATTFWGVLKVPVAMVVVGAASWAFLYEGKIGERTWLIMLAVAVFPWLGDSISAIGKVIRGGNHSGGK